MLRGKRLLVMLAVVAGLTGGNPASAQNPAEFYKNKEIRMLISHPAGGGYDLYARFFARHLSRFLPGNPTVIPQNMPGGAGVVMASYIYSSAPQDGTVIGLGPGSTGTAALFGSPGARYDARNFSWIGSMTADVAVSIAWHTAAVKTAKDLFTTELITGGAGVTDQSVMYPVALSRILGVKFKVITGYGGTADTTLAMERGETFRHRRDELLLHSGEQAGLVAGQKDQRARAVFTGAASEPAGRADGDRAHRARMTNARFFGLSWPNQPWRAPSMVRQTFQPTGCNCCARPSMP